MKTVLVLFFVLLGCNSQRVSMDGSVEWNGDAGSCADMAERKAYKEMLLGCPLSPYVCLPNCDTEGCNDELKMATECAAVAGWPENCGSCD